jgi:xanthine dehydrogenase accessory factor
MKTWPRILDAVEECGAAALVSVVATAGSVPRECGARLIVSAKGFHGTIGGGALEWRAMATAQAMLGNGPALRITKHALGPDLGQCCGGRVQLVTEVFDRTSLNLVRDFAHREVSGGFEMKGRIAGQDFTEWFGEDRRRLHLFGAGHVGRALVLALAALPFDVQWIDSRPGVFPSMTPQNVSLLQPEDPVVVLRTAPAGSFVMVMTHSHALDLALVDAALRNDRVVHTGVIGSATKRARFEKRLRDAGVDGARVDGLICPIGVPGIRSKEPSAIAAAVAAQVLVLHENRNEVEIRSKQNPPLFSGVGT